jgi:hypothetical protein
MVPLTLSYILSLKPPIDDVCIMCVIKQYRI